VDYKVIIRPHASCSEELTSLYRTSVGILVVVVRLAYLVQRLPRRNGHSHGVGMRSDRHAVPLDIRGSGSFCFGIDFSLIYYLLMLL